MERSDPHENAGFDASTPLAGCSLEELQRVVQFIQARADGAALVEEALARVREGEARAPQQPQKQPQKKQEKKKKKKGAPREFDFSRFGTRHIALQLAYEGDRYLGFSTRHDGDEETVEGQLLAALMKTKLVKDRTWACYSRCGRTDRGVSALRQVVGVRVRSILLLPVAASGSATNDAAASATGAVRGDSADDEGEEEGGDEGAAGDGAGSGDIWSVPYTRETAGELDYCALLNRVLPPDNRCLGWAPTPPGFSARFCASHRTYRYFFDGTGLDLGAMRRAVRRLEGDHDFRNFCKMDATAVHSFRRVIHHARVLEVGAWRWAVDTEGGALNDTPTKGPASSTVCCLQIQGQAFLWHMVRCIMAVLFLVGQGLEAEDIVAQLLDVEGRFPAKPHYAPAPDGPLVLHDCAFLTLPQQAFLHTPAALARLWAEQRVGWGQAAVRLARVENALAFLGDLPVGVRDVEAWAAAERARRVALGGGGGAGKGRKRPRRDGNAEAAKMEMEMDVESGAGAPEPEGAGHWSGGRERVPWREALGYLRSHGLCTDGAAVGGEEQQRNGGAGRPGGGSGRYTPLGERAVGKTYAATVADMSGRKRALYEEAHQKRAAAERRGGDEAFFHRLRGQGAAAASASSAVAAAPAASEVV